MLRYSSFIVKFSNKLFSFKLVLLELVLIFLSVGIDKDIFLIVLLLDGLVNSSVILFFMIGFINPIAVLGLGNCVFEFIIISPDFCFIKISNSCSIKGFNFVSNTSLIFLKFLNFFI